jgi:prepilin-type N-terminal cleavage/methylation domain-containing protein
MGNERGFTMIEVIIVVLIVLIISATAIVRTQPAIQQSRANAAMNEVLTAFRTAQSYAVQYRRFVQITFPSYPGTKNQISIIALNHLTPGAGTDVTLSTITFANTVNYQLFSGFPDTPDAFGNTTAVYFEGIDGGPTAGMYFQPDGTFVDTVGNPVNGTVFLGVNNFNITARAVTVLGSTGRVKAYFGVLGKSGSYGWAQTQ